MPAITRLGDACTGHGCFPPRQSTSASSNVFINNKGVHRQGDSWDVHCCGTSCHSSNLSAGSNSVFINGKSVGRIGDSIACGSIVAEGSANVFAN